MGSKDFSNAMTIAVEVGDELTKLSFSKGEDGPIEVCEMARTGMVMSESGRPALKSWRIRADDSSEVLRKIFEGLQGHHPFINEKRAKFHVVRERCFLSATASLHFEPSGAMGTYRIDPGIRDYARREILRMIHLPGLRGIPERTYPLVPTGKVFPGLFQNYAASVIHTWAKKKEAGKLRDLNKALDLLELQSNISHFPCSPITEFFRRLLASKSGVCPCASVFPAIHSYLLPW
jgi:hypothetical protein